MEAMMVLASQNGELSDDARKQLIALVAEADARKIRGEELPSAPDRMWEWTSSTDTTSSLVPCKGWQAIS
jgi:hypothetical protein